MNDSAGGNWRSIFEAADEALLLLDDDGRIVTANRHALHLYGSAEPPIGKWLGSLIDATPEELAAIWRPVRARRQSSGSAQLRRADGTSREIEYSITAEVLAGRHLVVARDVSERRALDRTLRARERLIAAVFTGSPIGMALVSPAFKFTDVNPALCAMLGYSRAELLGRTFVDITHADDVNADVALADQLFAGEIPSYRIDKRYITRQGREFWVQLTASVIRDEDGSVLSGLAMVEDVGDRKEIELGLRRAALRDELTGLGNRTLLLDRLGHALARRPDGTSVAVAYLDLDGFKGLNDTMGHAAGDIILRVTADRIRSELREEDTAARMGGDEFVVLLENVTDPRIPGIVMSRLRHAVQEPIEVPGVSQSVRLDVSIGMAVGEVGRAESATLLAEADRLMYEAKPGHRRLGRPGRERAQQPRGVDPR